jgi:hypothetical protein
MPTSIDLDELRALRTPLVVYVGSELTRAAGLPTRRELARLLLGELPDETTERRRRELSELCDRAELDDAFTEFERDLTRARFGLVVERALRDDGLEVPPLARVLACLGSHLHGVVTPNLDRLLERAFGARLVTHVRPSVGLIQREGWLLKIHGTLPDRSSWVFTRQQQARVSWRDPVYGDVLRSLFIARPMLFVGTTLDDPIFESIVAQTRGLAEGSPPRHWALLRRDQLTLAGRGKLDEAGIAAIVADSDDELLAILGSLAPDPSELPLLPIRRPTPALSDGSLRILFVAANPRDMVGLAVDHEQRAIREAIARARHRDRIELVVRSAASFADLSRALLEQTFDIVHVAGHGEPSGIVLDEGAGTLVPPEQLADLFDEYAYPEGRLRCVVLNACWSMIPGHPISAVPVIISMNGLLDDRAALGFAEGFYDAIGAGLSFAAAYREGRRRAKSVVPDGPFDAVLFERDAT